MEGGQVVIVVGLALGKALLSNIVSASNENIILLGNDLKCVSKTVNKRKVNLYGSYAVETRV